MMKYISILLFLGILNLSCHNNLNRDADYNQALNLFDWKLVNQFPREGEYKYLSLEVDTYARYNTVSIIATLNLSKDQFDIVYSTYKNKLIKNDDNWIVVVNAFLNNHNFPEPITVFCGDDCLNKSVFKRPILHTSKFLFQ